jgi:hypothetical protein
MPVVCPKLDRKGAGSNIINHITQKRNLKTHGLVLDLLIWGSPVVGDFNSKKQYIYIHA